MMYEWMSVPAVSLCQTHVYATPLRRGPVQPCLYVLRRVQHVHVYVLETLVRCSLSYSITIVLH